MHGEFILVRKVFASNFIEVSLAVSNYTMISSGSRGGGCRGGHAPPGPVKTSHKKDGHQRQPHRFHVS